VSLVSKAEVLAVTVGLAPELFSLFRVHQYLEYADPEILDVREYDAEDAAPHKFAVLP